MVIPFFNHGLKDYYEARITDEAKGLKVLTVNIDAFNFDKKGIMNSEQKMLHELKGTLFLLKIRSGNMHSGF